MRSRRTALALTAFVLLTAAGCGDDDAPSAEPAESTTATTAVPDEASSPSTESTPPAPPTTATSSPSTGEPAWTLVSSEGDESSFGLAAIGEGEIVATGWTSEDLAAPSAGDRDIWLARIGPEPTDTTWDLQWGEANQDSPLGIDVGEGDAVFVGGFTDSDLVDTNRGKVDGWIGRIEPDGTSGWSTQFGGPDWDRVFDISAADVSVFATGYTLGEMAADGPGGNDGFVAAFDPETGAQQWLTLVGTPAQDWGQGSAVTSDGGVVITGYTTGDLARPNAGARDAFVARLSPSGAIDWTAQIGSAGEDWTQGVGIDPDGGAIAIAGYTDGEVTQPPGGDRDALVAVFEADGTLRWVQQFGTGGTDSAFEPRFVGDQVVVTGTAGGVLGASHAGGRDAMVAWLDAETGELGRVEQFGTDTDDEAYGLAVTSDGSVWASGSTGGAISEGVEVTDTDIFIIRFGSDAGI